MTRIKVSGLERADVVRLATENGKDLYVNFLGVYPRFIDGVERQVWCWVVDSMSGEHMHFHDVDIWQAGPDLLGECDSLENEPDDERSCKANRLGGRLCSHLSRCLVELEGQNKIQLSFVGDCAMCGRANVRVAFDGIDYRCVDQRSCGAASHDSLSLAKDTADIFGTEATRSD